MTPTRLRAFAAVVRLGSVKLAAAELEVSEAAVSLHVAQLRKELGDRLFTRTASGLAFTPGGLRLASRAAEMLSLQARTVVEVGEAGHGRRLLRLAASSLFAEYAAPGLIGLFAGRADDLDVELSVHDPRRFGSLLHSRTVDVAVGPSLAIPDATLSVKPFLNYQVAIVCAPGHALAGKDVQPRRLREETWLLGPSAVSREGAIPSILRRLNVPEEHQQIFQSHAAAMEEAQRGKGVVPMLQFAVAQDLATGRLLRLGGPSMSFDGGWVTLTLADHGRPPAVDEFVRFVTTPRATQAMLRGPGVNVNRFRPSIHITLWS